MMSKTVIPHGYKPLLDLYQTQTAIGCLKRNFEQKLCAALNLKRVSAPLFVEPSTGLNDDLNGVERPVSFDLKETGRTAQVVHSPNGSGWRCTSMGLPPARGCIRI